MAGPREARPPQHSDDHHRRRESYPPAGTDTLIAIGEAEQRLEALAVALTEALIGDLSLVSAALTSIRLADKAALHLRTARLAAAA